MHLHKEAFEFGNGDEVLKLIFTPHTAKDFSRLLEHALRPKEKGGEEYEGKFYICVSGSCIPISLSNAVISRRDSAVGWIKWLADFSCCLVTTSKPTIRVTLLYL